MLHHPPKVTQTTSFMEPSLIESTNVTNGPKQVHQPQHTHGRTDHGLKRINHGKVIGNSLAGDIHNTYGAHQSTTIGGGYFNTKGSYTRDRWTQLTLLINIMTRTTIAQSNLSVSTASVIFSFFYHEWTCRRLFRCIRQCETETSSWHRIVCQEMERLTCRHELPENLALHLQARKKSQLIAPQ